MKRRKWYEWSLIGVLGLAVAGSTLALARPDYTFFDPLVGVKSIISQRYVTQPDEKAMQLGAIEGMLETLNDPYTVYVPPSATKDFNKELTGDFVGIGVQVVSKDGWLTVVTPLEDSPAFKAGVMADDRIVEIEGKSTLGLGTEECIDLLQGEAGKQVSFVVERAGKRLPMTVTREQIITKMVKGFHWEGTGEVGKGSGSWQYVIDPARKIAYLRLTQFTPASAGQLAEALAAIGADKGAIGGLVLDLRGNPGGVLDDAIQIADMFLSDGVIVSTRGRAHPEEVARAEKDGTLPDFPMAILINGGSASASEVLTGALVENKRAIAVGTRSFGKGLVQTVHTIAPGGGQLKVTEQRYYLPSGRCIQRSDESPEWGVDPTDGFFVPMTDEQTTAMLNVMRNQLVIGGERRGATEDQWSNPDWILDKLKDPQLAAAVKAVQGKVDGGDWKPTGQPLPEGKAVAGDELTRAMKLRDRIEKELEKLDKKIDGMQTATGKTDETARPDLWPDAVEVVGGHLDVFDKEGKLVTRLKVTGPDLERWLIDADVKKEGAEAPKPDGTK